MVQPYSAPNVHAAIERIAHRAIELKLAECHWFAMDAGGFRSSGWKDDLPPIGRPTGTIRIRYVAGGMTSGLTPPGAKLVENLGDREYIYEIDPWQQVYSPTIQAIESVLEGLADLPDPADFAAPIDKMGAAVGSLTPVEGNPSDLDGDGLSSAGLASDLHLLDKWIGPDTPDAWAGETIYAFDSSYGPERINTVMGNQTALGVLLGVVLQGERNLWERAREDAMALLENAELAYAQKGSGVQINLKVVGALAGLVADFVPKPYSVVLATAAKVLGILDMVLPKPSEDAVENPITGSTAVEVFTSLCGAYTKLNEQVTNQERELGDSLGRMTDKMAAMPLSDFHIHPEAGIDSGLERGKRITADPVIMGDIGYNVVPRIASTMARSAESAQESDRPWAWQRSRLGMCPSGPYERWSGLLDEFDKVTTGSASEFTTAGRLLAEAAGGIKQVDEETRDATRGLANELERGETSYARP